MNETATIRGAAKSDALDPEVVIEIAAAYCATPGDPLVCTLKHFGRRPGEIAASGLDGRASVELTFS